MVAVSGDATLELMTGSGQQEFEVDERNLSIDGASHFAKAAFSVEVAGPVLDEYLDAELARLGLSPDRLALVGFSQGTMMSLHVGLRRTVKPAAIVGFSGLLAGAPPDAGFPPILLTHGDSDTVIPPQAMFLAAGQLGLAGAAVQWHLARGMGHGIDPEGLLMAGKFLALAFDGRLKSDGEVCSVYKPS